MVYDYVIGCSVRLDLVPFSYLKFGIFHGAFSTKDSQEQDFLNFPVFLILFHHAYFPFHQAAHYMYNYVYLNPTEPV